jgi:hypothetical protein
LDSEIQQDTALDWTARGAGVAIPSTILNGKRVELLKKSLVCSSAGIGECKPSLELPCNAALSKEERRVESVYLPSLVSAKPLELLAAHVLLC